MAHCISADYALGAGIAKDVECRYNVRNQLKRLNRRLCPDCIAVGNILNIVTKPRYWDKPTYDSFTKALIYTKEVCKKLGISHIVMPKIGCGLDGLDWTKCRQIIINTLVSYNIDVDVYEL